MTKLNKGSRESGDRAGVWSLINVSVGFLSHLVWACPTLSHTQVLSRRDPLCESGAASHAEKYLNFAASKLWNLGPADGNKVESRSSKSRFHYNCMPQKQRVFCSLNKIYGSALMPTFPPHTLCLWLYACLSWITIITPFPGTLLPLLQHWLPLETLSCPQTRMPSKHNLSK